MLRVNELIIVVAGLEEVFSAGQLKRETIGFVMVLESDRACVVSKNYGGVDEGEVVANVVEG
jgi:hypothetical protein|uniref:Uncharacterized protein n=1 Tax=Populus trichocarpa TaxID=3694 RepID=B9HFG7_POPTR